MKRIFSISVIAISLFQGCTTLDHPDKTTPAKDKLPQTTPQEQKPGAQQPDKQAKVAAEALPAIAQPIEPPPQLDPEVLYRLMSAEIAGQRGQLALAVKNYLVAAELSQDISIAERATRIAVYARDDNSSLRAARIWVKLEPDNLEAHQVLAALLVRKGEIDKAQQHLEKLVQAKGNANNGFMLISSLLSKEKDKRLALESMKKLVNKYQDNPQALYALSHLAYVVGSFNEAENSILRVISLEPAWGKANLLYANILTRLGKDEVVPGKLEAFLRDNPNDESVRVYLARKYIDLKQYENARGHFLYLLKQKPGDVDALYALGLLATQLNQLDEAESYFLRLLELKRRENEAYYHLGQIAESREKFTAARRWYNKVEEGNYYLEANIRIANLIAREGDILAAREHLQNIAPDNAQMELQLYLAEGEILRDAGQYLEAVQLYSDALEQLPDNIELLYARALTAEKFDNIHQTILDLSRIVELEPSHTQALNALGYTLVDQTDRIEEGFEYIRKAYARNPGDAAIIDSMGWAYYRMGNHQEALKYLRTAFEKLRDAEIAAHLGEVLWVLGDEEQARQIWTEALRQTPGNKTLLNVIERFKE
ncbi:MAG: tetratricopeptide repeat protein [Thioalkalispiraceae bacterium]|jgi:tetratricopeptide (TPR) repeat protein